MVIAQITDIHISPDLKPVHEVDVSANFRSVLKDVLTNGDITHIVLSGDLCYQDPSTDTMEFVKQELDRTGIPYFVIPGNHDDSAAMAGVFDLEHCFERGEVYYNALVGGVNLIFLDTAKGCLSDQQASWLKTLDDATAGASLIFMHHPPVDAVPYMDLNYALRDKPGIQHLLCGLKSVQAIFCGHYHVSKTVELDGLPPVHIAPSTFFQIDDVSEDFKVASRDIGWRKIRCNSGLPTTSVKWLKPPINPD